MLTTITIFNTNLHIDYDFTPEELQAYDHPGCESELIINDIIAFNGKAEVSIIDLIWGIEKIDDVIDELKKQINLALAANISEE